MIIDNKIKARTGLFRLLSTLAMLAGFLLSGGNSAGRAEAATLTAYFDNSLTGWGSVNVWIWDDNSTSYTGDSWPGMPCELKVIDGRELWVYSFDPGVELVNPCIIFNDPMKGEQTGDLEFVDGGVYNYDGWTKEVITPTVSVEGKPVTVTLDPQIGDNLNMTGTVSSSGGKTVIQPLETLAENDVTVTFATTGTTKPAYYENGDNVRLYKGSTFTISAPGALQGITIHSITKYVGDYMTVSSGTLTYDTDANTYTWTPDQESPVSEVTFTKTDASGTQQVRFTSLDVTYLGEGEALNPPLSPSISVASRTFSEPFTVEITARGNNTESIRYTLDGTDPTAETGLLYTGAIEIPIGANVTLKAAAFNADGSSSVTTAVYTYEQKYRLNVHFANPGGIDSYYLNTSDSYGTWFDGNSAFVAPGDMVYMEFYINDGYQIGDITMNGSPLELQKGSTVSFTMPSSDVDLIVNAVYNPESPGDPQPGEEHVQKYTLTLVSNPTGASTSFRGAGKHATGESVSIYSYQNSGYVFRGWTRDGQPVTLTSGKFTMPAEDVVLTANYDYNPSSPDDPSQPALQHPLTAVASPVGGGSVSVSSSKVTFGERYYVYASANSGYKFRGWIVNGEAVPGNNTTYSGTMTEKGAHAVALFVYDPSSPDEPSKNYYNAADGRMILDHFTPGNLYNEANKLVNGNFSNVGHLIVKGRMNSSDIYSLARFNQATTIDVSRTSGLETLSGKLFSGTNASSILLPSTLSQVASSGFSGCPALTSLTIYASVPPTCDANAFSGLEIANITLYVPQEAMPLYIEAPVWKDFVILPISNDAHVLQVNLPAECADGRYKNNSLEIVNQSTGVRQKYVVSDRLIYTFNGLQKDEQYNVYMNSQAGLEIGRLEGVLIPDRDTEVTLSGLRALQTVSASVADSNGADVTDQTTVEWLKPLADGTTLYLRKGVQLGDVPEGQALICRVTLGSKLAATYQAPAETTFTVSAEDAVCNIVLAPYRTVTLSGKVCDAEGKPIKGATASATQMLAGKYPKSYTAKTDAAGAWQLPVLSADGTEVTFAAADCVSKTDTLGAFAPDATQLDLGEIRLRAIAGARLTLAFTYREAGQSEVSNTYEDQQNIAFEVFNLTKNRAQTQVSRQLPVLAVLDETIQPKEALRITATSIKGEFNPIVKNVVIDENCKANVTFDIVGRGGIDASFISAENPSVTAMLYGSDGHLVEKADYAEAKASFRNLNDGEYTLVTMGSSQLMSTIARVEGLTEAGLTVGKDYVKNSVKVESGEIAAVNNDEIPAFDESLFYYTKQDATTVNFNKQSVVTGNFLTWNSKLDFKQVYKDKISDVSLTVDFPAGVDLVESSVIQGPNTMPYTFDGKRLSVQLGNNYTSLLRFCVVPTTGGNVTLSGTVNFKYDGKTISQPLGSAMAKVKDIEFKTPSVIAGTSFKATGMAAAGSKIEVYEEGSLIGSGKADRKGAWSAECSLDNPANLSKHNVSAEILTSDGRRLQTETREITYDRNAIQVSKVTMINTAHPASDITLCDYVTVYDFQDPSQKQEPYWYWPSYPGFTFLLEFTDNDPDRIDDVILYVHTTTGFVDMLYPKYDEKRHCWIAQKNYNSNMLPTNVSVDFEAITQVVADREEIDNSVAAITEQREEVESTLHEAESLENEAVAINEQIDVDSQRIQTLASQLKVCENSDERQRLLIELFGVAGVELSESAMQYEDPEEVTTEYLLAELDEIQHTLNEKPTVDSETLKHETETIVNNSESLLALLEESPYNPSFIENYDEKSFDIETEDGTYRYEELAASEVDVTSWEEDYVTSLSMSDGSVLKTYIGDDHYVILDEFKNRAWRITLKEEIAKSIRRKLTGGDVVASLKEAVFSLNTVKTELLLIVEGWQKQVDKEIAKIEKTIEELDSKWLDNLTESNHYGRKVEKLERHMKMIETQIQNGTNSLLPAERQNLEDVLTQLKNERSACLSKVEECNVGLNRSKKELSKLKAARLGWVTALGTISDFYDIAKGLVTIVNHGNYGVQDLICWTQFIDQILPCQDDESKANSIKRQAIDSRGSHFRGYLGSVTLTAIGTGLSGYCAFNKAAKLLMKVIGPAIADFISNTSEKVFNETQQKSRSNFIRLNRERENLKCKKNCGEAGKPECPKPPRPSNGGKGGGQNGTGGQHQSGHSNTEHVMDPSGYVYEAVPENRVEGVQASIYYKETVEDMYGDPHENIVLWNAEEYAQQNPLFTDENGMYQWDVPQGLWQVKFEKDGYLTAYSEWLPVPPPQLDVNIAIVQNKQPEVIEAHAYETGVEVQFDKYMDPSTLTVDNIFLTASGEKIKGEIEFVNAAVADLYADPEDTEALRYASRVRFVPEESLSMTAGEVRLTVNRNVLSYAGIPMTETYAQVLDIEKEVKSIMADDVKVLYGGEKQLTVFAVPFDAAAGRTLRVANSSELILGVNAEEVTLDDEGKGVITLTGELPGHAQLSFSIDDVAVTGTAGVDVVTKLIEAEAPKASRASGTAVYRGTKLQLTTETEGAEIYFTTDGSCPCDVEGTRRKYTVPIVINDDMQISAVTSVEGELSDIIDFNYTIKRSDMDFNLDEGWSWISHNFESPLKPADLAADEKVEQILGRDAQVVRDPKFGLIGTLTDLVATESYKVQTSSTAARLRLSDYAWNPATPIALESGWNWIGYPVGQTMTPDEAFAGCEPAQLDMVVGQKGFTQFDGEHWVGTLETMSPGAGYMYKSASDGEIVFNTSIVSNAAARYATGISANLPLVVDIRKYPSVMPLIAEVVGESADDCQLIAFSGSECRGIAREVNGMKMMNIYGEPGDKITLQVTDAQGESLLASSIDLPFSEEPVGDVLNPYTIMLDPSGIDKVRYDGNVRVGVDGDVLIISGVDPESVELVEVYDLDGSKLVRRDRISDSRLHVNLDNGIYVVVVKSNGEYTYHKIDKQ